MVDAAAAAAALAAANANVIDDGGMTDSDGADDLAQAMSNIPMPSAAPAMATGATPMTEPAMARGAKRGAEEGGAGNAKPESSKNPNEADKMKEITDMIKQTRAELKKDREEERAKREIEDQLREVQQRAFEKRQEALGNLMRRAEDLASSKEEADRMQTPEGDAWAVNIGTPKNAKTPPADAATMDLLNALLKRHGRPHRAANDADRHN